MPRLTLALALLLAAAAAHAEAGQPSEAAAEKSNRRAIAGHEFQPTGTVHAPLAVSSFGMEDRLSYGSATGPRYDLDGNPNGERTYSFGGMVMSIGFQTAVSEAIAIRGALDVSLFSGTDGLSALVVGTTIQPGIRLGAEWSRALGRNLRIGASLDYQNAPQLNLLIMAAIQAALASGSADGAAAFEQDNVVSWAPAVSLAWVPHRALGLVGRLGYVNSGLETPTSGTLRRQAVSLGLAADLDLRHFWPTVPVGASLTYVDSIPLAGSISGVSDLGLGLMYNGNSSLSLGTILGVQRLKIRPQYPDPLRSDSPYLTIVMRAYWP